MSNPSEFDPNLIQFDPNQPSRLVEQLRSSFEALDFSKTGFWTIDKDNYKALAKIMVNARAVRPYCLIIQFNRPTIILQPTIRFEKLVYLQLEKCEIVNLQFMIHLSAPFLEGLRLNDNFITSCRSLRKCNFTNLKLLQLENNPLFESDWLGQFAGKSQTFKFYPQEFFSQEVVHNLNFLMKCQVKFGMIYCESEYRIRRDKFWAMLKRTKRQADPAMKICTYKVSSAM